MVNNNNNKNDKDKDNNNSSNSLVFGQWPQTKKSRIWIWFSKRFFFKMDGNENAKFRRF